MTEEKKKFSLAVISISQILKKSTLKQKKNKGKSKKGEKKNKMRLGDVFVVNDHMVGSPHRKPRAVVIVKTPKSKSGQVTVIPVRKRNGIFPF